MTKARHIPPGLRYQTTLFSFKYICLRTNAKNLLSGRLKNSGFLQVVQCATHIQGGILDHVYVKHGKMEYKVDVSLYSPYYTAFGQDALLVTMMHFLLPWCTSCDHDVRFVTMMHFLWPWCTSCDNDAPLVTMMHFLWQWKICKADQLEGKKWAENFIRNVLKVKQEAEDSKTGSWINLSLCILI